YTSTKGGDWKAAQNTITEQHPNSTVVVRFEPVQSHLVPDVMDNLHRQFRALWKVGEVDPLLLIPAYILDFLCIHPFTDGNGRMARLLSLLLLYQSGYVVGRYISLERIVEETKESYYDTLRRSSVGWHEGNHTLAPWWDYF